MDKPTYLKKASEIAEEAGGKLRTERSKLAKDKLGDGEKVKIQVKVAELEADWMPKAEFETMAYKAAFAGLKDADIKALSELID
jgi:Na+-transporting NADH:ubiquinone oxidoreductase subunit NqrF